MNHRLFGFITTLFFATSSLVLISGSAFAHPGPESGLSELGVGTKLRLLKPLNFAAGVTYDYHLGRRTPTQYLNSLNQTETISCSVFTDGISSVDRKVPTNTVYEIESMGPGPFAHGTYNNAQGCLADAYTYVTFRNSQIKLLCDRTINGPQNSCTDPAEISLREFHQLIGDYFVIQQVNSQIIR
jgi:hypothetical protein